MHFCVCVYKRISVSESHFKTVAGQCLVEDLRSDLIFGVPDTIELNVFGFNSV